MKTPSPLIASIIACTLISCRNSESSNYDTASNPYGSATSSDVNAPYTPSNSASSNPTYDTPAAYDQSSSTASSNGVNAPYTPATSDYTPSTVKPKKATTSVRATPPRTSNKVAGTTNHIVAKGDSLSLISSRYKVPMASIKAANHMTSDVVRLGQTLRIPAR